MDEFNFKFEAELFSPWEAHEKEQIFCEGCSDLITGKAYFHKKLHFWIHESCSKSPSIITHPLHPQHLLTLRVRSTAGTCSFICNGCRDYYSRGYTYNCIGCEFDLCMKCGCLLSFFSKYDLQSLQERDKKAHIDNFSHDHTLTLCNVKEQQNWFCDCCRLVINGSAYICSVYCDFYLHESCSKFPPHITHPIHPHSLTLLRQNRNFMCNLCRDLCMGLSYNCEVCSFNLDVKCKFLMDENLVSQDRDGKARIVHFSHRHVLVQCNINIKRFDPNIYCCCCNRKAKGSIYVCFDCDFYIHESCKDDILLHQQVQHPWHPVHSLCVSVMDYTYLHNCKLCGMSIERIDLSCKYCDIHLHYACAKLFIRPLKLKDHNHNLFHILWAAYGSCHVCFKDDIRVPLYRCLDCDMSLHIECSSLPRVTDSKCHDHPLTLLDSIREFDFDEYYCDVCEEEGNPNHHLYSCEEEGCTYYAHIDCVITEDDEIQLEDSGSEDKDKAAATEEKSIVVMQEAGAEKKVMGSSEVSGKLFFLQSLARSFCKQRVVVGLVICLLVLTSYMMFWCDSSANYNVLRLARQEEEQVSKEDRKDLKELLDKDMRDLEIEIGEFRVKLEDATTQLELLRRKCDKSNIVSMTIRSLTEKMIISLRERLPKAFGVSRCNI